MAVADKKHLSRRQYRKQLHQQQVIPPKQVPATSVPKRQSQTYQLDFWEIFTKRPYLAVMILVFIAFLVMLKAWMWLFLVGITVGVGIFVIGHNHHPNRHLKLGFHLPAAGRLNLLKAIQLGGSLIMFLAAYMRQVVNVNFAAVGSTDGLNVVQGLLSSHGSYGQQGSYFLNLLNSLMGGSLWGSYRYATATSQLMSTSFGRTIVLWILLLMLAPALCVLAQFLREPISRRMQLITSLFAVVSFALTPVLMRNWVANHLAASTAANAAPSIVTPGPMAIVAVACALLVLAIAIYRELKHDCI